MKSLELNQDFNTTSNFVVVSLDRMCVCACAISGQNISISDVFREDFEVFMT